MKLLLTMAIFVLCIGIPKYASAGIRATANNEFQSAGNATGTTNSWSPMVGISAYAPGLIKNSIVINTISTGECAYVTAFGSVWAITANQTVNFQWGLHGASSPTLGTTHSYLVVTASNSIPIAFTEQICFSTPGSYQIDLFWKSPTGIGTGIFSLDDFPWSKNAIIADSSTSPNFSLSRFLNDSGSNPDAVTSSTAAFPVPMTASSAFNYNIPGISSNLTCGLVIVTGSLVSNTAGAPIGFYENDIGDDYKPKTQYFQWQLPTTNNHYAISFTDTLCYSSPGMKTIEVFWHNTRPSTVQFRADVNDTDWSSLVINPN